MAMLQKGSELCATKKAFLKKGWIVTEKGLWRRVDSTEAFVNIYPDATGDGETLYEFTITDPKGIRWHTSRELLKELEDLLA